MPNIPFDLVEKIVEQLPQEPYILRRLSLINKAFAGACQRVLFRKLILEINPDTFIVHYASAKAEELKEVLTESPHLHAFAQELRLAFASPLNTMHKEPYAKDPNVPILLDFLGPIRRLELSGPSSYYIYIWTDIPAPLTAAIERKAKSHALTSLYVSNCRNFPLDFFRLCEHVKDIELAYVTFWDLASSDVTVLIPSEKLTLKGIHFSGSKSASWKFEAPRLRVLKSVIHQEIECASLERVLRAGALTVQEMRVRLESLNPGRPAIDEIFADLSYLVNLRIMRLTAHIWRNGPIYPWFFTYLKDLIAPPRIEVLMLSIVFDDCEYEKWEDETLKLIEDNLTSGTWPELQLVHFELFSRKTGSQKGVERRIVNQMPKLSDKGMFKFSYYGRGDWLV